MRGWPRLAAVGPAALVLAACGSAGGGVSAGGVTTAPATTAPGTTAPTTTTAASAKFDATLTAPGHTAKVKVRWHYTIRVTDLAGKPIKAQVTVQIVDPLRQPHPVRYDATTKNIVNWPFTGAFRDYIEFPPDARGFTLTVRAILKTKGGTKTLDYPVAVQ